MGREIGELKGFGEELGWAMVMGKDGNGVDGGECEGKAIVDGVWGWE